VPLAWLVFGWLLFVWLAVDPSVLVDMPL
jgi:hypothetical protein